MSDRDRCRHPNVLFDGGRNTCASCGASIAFRSLEDDLRDENRRLRGELEELRAYVAGLEAAVGAVRSIVDSVQRGPRPNSHAEPYTRGMAQGVFVLAERIRINLERNRTERHDR